NPFGLTGFNQTFRKSETVDEPRASLVDVDRSASSRKAQSVLEKTGSRWEKIVGTLGAEKYVVYVGGSTGARREQSLRRNDGKIRGAFLGRRYVPFDNPGLRLDPFRRPS